jgi:hypothetical protein
MLLEVFLYLQILDVVSTLIGFSLGNTEASPFIRLLLRWGPVTGLVCSKLFAAGCLLVCIQLNRWGFIRWINYWYAALVTWNLYIILKVLNSCGYWRRCCLPSGRLQIPRDRGPS